MKVSTLVRVFKYDGQELPDPAPTFSAAQVMDFYCANFPELLNAELEGPNEVDGKLVYTFKRSTGTKGLGEAQAGVRAPFSLRLALVAAGQADPAAPRGRLVVDPELVNQHGQFSRSFNPQRSSQASKATLPGLPSAALPLLL